MPSVSHPRDPQMTRLDDSRVKWGTTKLLEWRCLELRTRLRISGFSPATKWRSQVLEVLEDVVLLILGCNVDNVDPLSPHTAHLGRRFIYRSDHIQHLSFESVGRPRRSRACIPTNERVRLMKSGERREERRRAAPR